MYTPVHSYIATTASCHVDRRVYYVRNVTQIASYSYRLNQNQIVPPLCIAAL